MGFTGEQPLEHGGALQGSRPHLEAEVVQGTLLVRSQSNTVDLLNCTAMSWPYVRMNRLPALEQRVRVHP